MNSTQVIKRLMGSLTIEQRDDILSLIDECKGLGATARQLLPFYVACLVEKPKLTKKEKRHGRNLGAICSIH